MRLLSILLRIGTVIFNLGLALFLLGVGSIALASGEELHLKVIPGIAGEALKFTLIGAGLFALVSIFAAKSSRKRGRLLMFFWNLLVVSILVCALTRPSYRFHGAEQLCAGAVLFGLSILALWGSWLHVRSAPPPLSG
jgi:hypothetical protein